MRDSDDDWQLNGLTEHWGATNVSGSCEQHAYSPKRTRANASRFEEVIHARTSKGVPTPGRRVAEGPHGP